MTADVNVTEKAAWRVFEDQERHRGVGGQVVRSVEPIHYRVARAALSALADPDVLAGIAGVLRDAEDEWVRRYADAEGEPPTRSEFQAAAVVEWLTGGAR